jgi:hypothetical protein|tara:strand:- start:347 stop:532 length:186 start_codon:yes stop_codon:yes gene_type:complete
MQTFKAIKADLVSLASATKNYATTYATKLKEAHNELHPKPKATVVEDNKEDSIKYYGDTTK